MRSQHQIEAMKISLKNSLEKSEKEGTLIYTNLNGYLSKKINILRWVLNEINADASLIVFYERKKNKAS